jgi:hypothetical protein
VCDLIHAVRARVILFCVENLSYFLNFLSSVIVNLSFSL